jgi:glutamate synthase (ferredoxin)
MMMVVPEAWEKHQTMSDDKKAFYEYNSCIMEPWDGPHLFRLLMVMLWCFIR